MMLLRAVFLICFAVIFVQCHPTMYKYNENRVLEADLVPVSSTVIPLPIYKVEYGFKIPTTKDEKLKKYDGPIELITVHTKKKPIPTPKLKTAEFSPANQISRKDNE